ncbi:conserved hypothetical protein [Ferrimonas balearica DSM 9799]|uniref:Uncharacterized protein n=1 Tax=Ferrimonas balearica (strain DSM 9799 / CCM 4581 / KCTC 23876 / PAT) TaxID=550540 RepID=E1SLE4_FERBD|nr:hypothetical protein [Ferrimonas balearica]ADN76508.1 conserved hypothetical protein [Ferrimonas balearica DSM 9799]
MVSAVSDTLSVQQRRQAQSAPISEAGAGLAGKDKTKSGVALPQWRMESYRRWASVGQGQHQVAAAQTGAQVLRQAKSQLTLLERQVEQALRQGGGDSQGMSQQRDRLLNLNAEYRGAPLIDQQLNLIRGKKGAAPRQYAIKGADLAAAKPRDERVSVQFGDKRTEFMLPGGVESDRVMGALKSGLSELGIQVQRGSDGRPVLVLDKAQQVQLEGGLRMAGQGQRLPAGDGVNIKTQEVYPWADPREWRFESLDQLKQAQAKIRKTLNKVESQISELDSLQAAVSARLDKIRRHTGTGDVDSVMAELNRELARSPFSSQVGALLAQANLSRSQVTDLLRA